MRILFVNTAPIIIRGLGPAFLDKGEQVKYINLDLGDSLEKAIDEFQPDLVFNDGGINRMEKLFPLLSEKGIPHVYWAIEDPSSYQLSVPYALKSSLVLTPCRESIAEYAKLGIKAHLMMFACHPAFHCRTRPQSSYHHDLVFVGNNYDYHPARREGVESVLRPALKHYPTIVYGNEWWLGEGRELKLSPEQYGGYLPNECLPAVCASAAIMLGIHSANDSETMMSMRTFEILGSAGFYLTQWTKAAECLFKNHHHLVWSRSEEETLELIDFYLARPELRKKIALQGQKEVYEQHTYHRRINTIENLLIELNQQQSSPSAVGFNLGMNKPQIKCRRAKALFISGNSRAKTAP